MQTTQSAHSWVWPYPEAPVPNAPHDIEVADAALAESATGVPTSVETAPPAVEVRDTFLDTRKLGVPPRERDARREIDRLRDEIEHLVRAEGDHAGETARAVVDTALESVTRLQIVTANIDACGPPSAAFAGAALVALADSRLTGHADAIERGMEYTADNQLRLLKGEK